MTDLYVQNGRQTAWEPKHSESPEESEDFRRQQAARVGQELRPVWISERRGKHLRELLAIGASLEIQNQGKRNGSYGTSRFHELRFACLHIGPRLTEAAVCL